MRELSSLDSQAAVPIAVQHVFLASAVRLCTWSHRHREGLARVLVMHEFLLI